MIWIDADAVPRQVTELLCRASQRRRVPLTFVANRPIFIAKTPLANAVQVAGGPDVADDYIAERCGAGELVITADVPLAARVIEAGAVALQPRGRLLDEENIDEHLSVRDFREELRSVGVEGGGPPPFDQRARIAFANALDRWLGRNWRP